jgi:TatD DNase family protein
MFIDTHCHLSSGRFAGRTSEVIARACDAGVTRLVAIATNLHDIPNVLDLARRHDEIYAAVGIHPGEVPDIADRDWLRHVDEASRHEKVVAIGEIGLDYFHPPPDGASWDACKAKQAAFFRQQLELAATRRLPVVVHQRGGGCWIDAVTIVNELGGEVRAQFHCYVGTWAEAAPVVARGHRISFTGIATYPKAPVVAACAQQAPAGTFMLETDAPYLAPVPHRGQLCEPAMVRATAEFIAARRGVSLESLAAETTTVARDFFRLA